jgi:hypothetical protein
MSERRELPPRRNRGQRAAQNGDEEEKDDRLYANIFGSGQLDEEEDIEELMRTFVYKLGREREAAQKMLFHENIRKYSYSRGYHYFFDLDNF